MKKAVLKIAMTLISLVTSAQMVNTGEMTVLEGTTVSIVPDFDNTSTGTLINDGDLYVYRNWNNDGMVDFLGTSGLTRFIGTMPQTISGSEVSYLYNALFSNFSTQPTFQLSGGLSVGNTSTFDAGIVDNDTYGGSFVFEQNGNHIATSDESHVDGRVLKIGDVSFDYPIGDGGYYRFAGISAPEVTTDAFEGKYYLENSGILHSHDDRAVEIELIDDAEYWTIESITGDSDVLVTLSWDEETTPLELLVAPQEAIHIVRWDVEEEEWVDEGGVVDIPNHTVTTAVSDYGIFTLGRVKMIEEGLPCGLVIYNAVTPNSDGSNDYFIIDRDNTCASNVHVQIFNRWGVKIFETSDYDTVGNVFDGFSDGRLTIENQKQLPTGTYYYILDFDYLDGNGIQKKYKKAGYLYLNGQ